MSQIMDCKMDSGFLEDGETMDENYDFSRILALNETIGVVDQLLLHEVMLPLLIN